MKILFTATNSLMSRLIRKVTREPFSHCAIQDGEFIIHSNLLGVHVEYAEKFLGGLTCCESVEVPDDMDKLYNGISKYDHSMYDYGALLYLGLRYLFPRLPKKNLWQVSGMFLCTEWVTYVLYGEADSEITPYQLYRRLTNV